MTRLTRAPAEIPAAHETGRRLRPYLHIVAATLCVAFGSGCAPATPTPSAPATVRGPAAEPDLPRIARSREGMVVTGSAFATDIARRVLAEGGNAVDAAVAAAFTLAVVEPSMSGIGGRTQLLIRTRDGDFAGIDGTTQVPASWPGGPGSRGEETYGYEAVAVPGTVAALATATQRFGTWPLARLLEPAIRLAEEGFLLPAPEAARIASVAARLREFEGSRHYFLRPDGSPFTAGERFRQPDLARTLRTIASGGAEAFYRGPIADAMVEDARANGGFLALADLAAYAAEDALVVRGSYRGHDLIGTYLPASGATTIEILQILDHLQVPTYAGTSRWVAVLAQALLLGFADRTAAMEPPSRKAQWLVSRELAAERARGVRETSPGDAVDDAPDVRATRATRTASDLGALAPVIAAASNASPQAVKAGDTEPEHTTHLSVADRNGMLVALTQSVGPTMGSKAAAPGLGFIYASTMGYLGEVRAGERPFSSQSPLIVLRNGMPAYVLGAAGARRIISAIVETLSRAIDGRESLERAMAGPRFHVTDDRVDLENRPGTAWDDDDAQYIGRYGFQTRMRDDAPYFARINGIAYDAATGEWVGVADPRWEGAAAGPSR